MNHIEVKVEGQNGNLWSKALTQEEYKKVKDFCKDRPSADAALVVLRTYSFSVLMKDLFCPAVRGALTVENCVLRLFAVVIAFCLDAVSLPIRLITLIPRMIHNSKKEDHPLRAYLKSEKVDKSLTDADWLKVKFSWKEERADFPPYENHKFKVDAWETKNVPLVDVPSADMLRSEAQGYQGGGRTHETNNWNWSFA